MTPGSNGLHCVPHNSLVKTEPACLRFFIQPTLMSTYCVLGSSPTLKMQFAHSSRPVFTISSGRKCSPWVGVGWGCSS